jgi:hypothetical protein
MKSVYRFGGMPLLGHQASKLLTLVPILRVESAATGQKRRFFRRLISGNHPLCAF